MSSLISLAVTIFTFVCLWKIFEKAHEPGWKALIPVYNAYILAKIANKKWTFWVQFILGGICALAFIPAMLVLFLSLATAVDNMPVEEYEYPAYEEYYQYDEYEDFYEFFGEEFTEDYNDNSYEVNEVALNKATPAVTLLSDYNDYYEGYELTEEEAAEIEAVIEALIEEMGSSLIVMIIAMAIPFLLALPLMIVQIIQYVGLSKAFGLHGAFALGLLFAKPVCLGVMAFAPDVRYIGDGSAPAPTHNTYNNAPYEQPVQNNTYNNPTYGYDTTERFSAPQIHRCPSCGYESQIEPRKDSFCPNCGHLYR